MTKPRRIDQALVAAGLVGTVEEARAIIAEDRVTVNGAPVLNAARQFVPGDQLAILAHERFVSRGGEKLDAALRHFEAEGSAIEVANARVIDVGASTGGFVDCLLQRGARRVVACDVGVGLLHPKIAADPRVHVLDGVNARELAAVCEREGLGDFDLLVADLSFISLRLVVATFVQLVRTGGEMLLLVKPQFEATKAESDRGAGVITDETVRRRCIEEVKAACLVGGARPIGEVECAIRGPAGNREHWLRVSIV